MRWWIALALAFAGCAVEERELAPAKIEPRTGRAPTGADEAPPMEVVIRSGERARTLEALDAVRVGRAVVLVDRAQRVVRVGEDGREEVLGAHVAGALIARNGLVVWSEGDAPEGTRVRAWRAHVSTIATSSGAMAPLGFVDADTIALVGAGNGGVAGLWLVDAREGASLECVTNCALRTGRAWGAEYVPPPRDATSIEVSESEVRFVDVEGTSRRIARGSR